MQLDAQIHDDDLRGIVNWQKFLAYINTEPQLQSAQRCVVQRLLRRQDPSDQDWLSCHWIRQDGKQTQGVSLQISYFKTISFGEFKHKRTWLSDVPVLDPRCYSCTRAVREVRKMLHGPQVNIGDQCLQKLVNACTGKASNAVTRGSHCLFCGRIPAEIAPIYSLIRAATYMGMCKECLSIAADVVLRVS